MAQFIGRIKGQRGEATRLGTKASGVTVEANGWNIGVKAGAFHISSHGANGLDVVEVYLTGGSNDACAKRSLGFWRRTADGFEPCTSIGTTIGEEVAR